jgi:alkylhydroperoxidase family enzyme
MDHTISRVYEPTPTEPVFDAMGTQAEAREYEQTGGKAVNCTNDNGQPIGSLLFRVVNDTVYIDSIYGAEPQAALELIDWLRTAYPTQRFEAYALNPKIRKLIDRFNEKRGIDPWTEDERIDAVHQIMPGVTPEDLQSAYDQHYSSLTPNQLQQLIQEQQLPEDSSEVVHHWPDGWSIRRLNTYGDMRREGVIMHHCWDTDSPSDDEASIPHQTYHSLRDPQNIPHASFYYAPPGSDYWTQWDRPFNWIDHYEQGGDRDDFYDWENREPHNDLAEAASGPPITEPHHLIHEAYGHGNQSVHPRHQERIDEWLRSMGGPAYEASYTGDYDRPFYQRRIASVPKTSVFGQWYRLAADVAALGDEMMNQLLGEKMKTHIAIYDTDDELIESKYSEKLPSEVAKDFNISEWDAALSYEANRNYLDQYGFVFLDPKEEKFKIKIIPCEVRRDSPREDIKKLQDLHGMRERQQGDWIETQKNATESWGNDPDKVKAWFMLHEVERSHAIRNDYRPGFDPKSDIQQVAKEAVQSLMADLGWDEEYAWKQVGGVLKAVEVLQAPNVYDAIAGGLRRMQSRYPASYKLWPWFVTQMKRFAKNYVLGTDDTSFVLVQNSNHFADITGQAGELLNIIRQENRQHELPPNFDVKHLNFEELGEWLTEYQAEHRSKMSQGEVVYEFPNGWTMQHLTTPDQLAFEGDEMGHCVGGYGGQVERGDSVIYSLRDKKGVPHATIEMEGQQQPNNGDTYDDGHGSMNEINVQPHMYGFHGDIGSFQADPWQVVQIQGKGNSTPKPEYQGMVKEWLDQMRGADGARGTSQQKFQWSGDYYAPHDQDAVSDLEDAQDLLRWWGTAADGRDAYGMPPNAPRVIGSVDDFLKGIIYSLYSGYDRSNFITSDWEGMAQAYYALLLSEGAKPQERQTAVEKLDEVMMDIEHDDDYMHQHVREEVEEALREEGFDEEQIEQKLDDQHDDEDYERLYDKFYSAYQDSEWRNAYKFIQYLHFLTNKQGPNAIDEPFPKYEDLEAMPWKSDGTESIPGALSHVISEVIPFGPKPNSRWQRGGTALIVNSCDGQNVHYRVEPDFVRDGMYTMPIQQWLREVRDGLITQESFTPGPITANIDWYAD